MIDAVSFGVLCGYAGTLWCILNLGWGLLRNDAKRTLIYGIGCFGAFIVALNIGGVLNEETWAFFGCCVFGIHFIASIVKLRCWKIAFFGFMFGISILSAMGLI